MYVAMYMYYVLCMYVCMYVIHICMYFIYLFIYKSRSYLVSDCHGSPEGNCGISDGNLHACHAEHLYSIVRISQT